MTQQDVAKQKTAGNEKDHWRKCVYLKFDNTTFLSREICVVEICLKYFDLEAISETSIPCELFCRSMLICYIPLTPQIGKMSFGSLCVTFSASWFPDLGIAQSYTTVSEVVILPY